MGVSFLITEIDLDVASKRILTGIEKAMVLTPDNIAEVFGEDKQAMDNTTAALYKGYVFVIDWNLLRKSKHCSMFIRSVSYMVRVWRHLGWSIIIILSTKERVLVGDATLAIDKYIRAYINEVMQLWPEGDKCLLEKEADIRALVAGS